MKTDLAFYCRHLAENIKEQPDRGIFNRIGFPRDSKMILIFIYKRPLR